jgi:DNA-binding Xre family transcriptional regulator
MTIKRIQQKIDWTPEDRARHKTVQKIFQDEPSIDELIARGELTGQGVPLGTYLAMKLLVKSLRVLRQEANLSLAEVSKRSGMDKAMLSRLETGQVNNPGIETISRYLSALDKAVEWRIVPAPAKKPA